jgi:protein-S-isoprenylcysteine O-methyltransferase Ste14
MATSQAVAPSAASNVSLSLIRLLSLLWLDRSIATIACIPLAWGAYFRYQHFHHGLPLIASVANILILIVTMVIRRPPRRVTPNPLFWLLAFVASYWQILILGFLQAGRPVVSNWSTTLLAALGLLVMVWARFSLGRNIGLVPAQRELVSSGAYAFMSHPVYTAVLLTNGAFLLRAFSPLNALLIGLGIFWFIPVKSLVEEDFLRADPEYADYMRRVRTRWIPFVV